MTSGSGMPTDPGFRSPFMGFATPATSASVSEYASTIEIFESSSKRRRVSAISGAAPDAATVRQVKSTLPAFTSRWFRSAL